MTDRFDGPEGATSEDLIRQAREAYVPAGDAAGDPTPYRRETATTAPSALPTAAGGPSPSEYVRAEYQTDVPQAAQMPSGATTYQAQRPSFLQRFGGLTIGIVVVIGFVLFSVFDKTTDVEDLAVGDCLLMPDAEEISSVESAECSAGHELEVFALVTLVDGVSAPYPGEDAVAEAIFELCLPRFEPYVGVSYDQSIWYINAIFPTQQSWEDVDDRAGTCVLYQPGFDDEAKTLTGSARGSAE